MNTSVVVCVKDRFDTAPSCAGGGGVKLIQLLEQEFAARGMEVPVRPLFCFGRCKEGPNLRIAPGGAFFTHRTPESLEEVITAVAKVLEARESAPQA
ncbi:MAG: (2Fe-2S) ferredoxin domain-containing protein [Magnetococcales bacterium]|nr:(2Fe-2S) ferredoxin domain-containing protein [Magnetococcales bacterium]